MASTPFTYQGASYVIDDQGQITTAQGTPLNGPLQGDVGLWQAAATAQNAPTTPAAPGALPTTPPRAATPVAPTQLASGGDATALPPQSPLPPARAPTPAAPAAPAALPTTPPRIGVGSDAGGRAQLKSINDQIAPLLAKQGTPDGLSSAETTLLSSLNGRAATVADAIAKAEATPASDIIGTPTASDQYIMHRVPAGTVLPDGTTTAADTVRTEINPTWDHTTTGTKTVQVGNHMVVVTPPTPAAIAADPSAGPTTTVAYTDTDAQRIADGNLAVSQSNAKVSAAAQAATAYASQVQADLATRVSNGEDAASVRAEQAQKATELHQAWVEADGDARRASSDVAAYNTERHQTAQDTLGQAQLAQTATAQAAQDATARRGQDIGQQTSQYSTDAASKTARMNAGNTLLQNSLSALAEINKALPPGSALAGQALEGMMRYGQKFLEGMANGSPAPEDAAAKALAAKTTPAAPGSTTAPGEPIIDPNAQPRADAATAITDPTTGLAAPGTAGTVAPGSPNYAGNSTPSFMLGAGPGAVNTGGPPAPAASPPPPPPDFAAQALGNPALGPQAAPPPSPAPTAPDQSAALAAQNAASHQQTMLAPDGSPFATPADVARIQAARGGAM